MAPKNSTSDRQAGMANRPDQKIRTIELDGKTVKLQIVCISTIRLCMQTLIQSDSGIPQAKRGSEPSHPPTTVEHMASALSTM